MLLNKMKKLFTLLLLLSFSFGFSQVKDFKDVVLDDLINDTQYSNDSSDDIEILWWLPTEYWQVVFAQDEMTSASEAQMLVELLEEYTIIIVIKGKVGLFGGVSFAQRSEIEDLISVSYNDTKLSLTNEDKLEPDFVNFISMIKPIMKNIMGPMGENMQIFVFENRHKDVINAKENGTVKMTLGEFNKDIDLPLSSLLMQKVCPTDKKLLNGIWTYCPFHGTELKNQ